MVCVCGLAEQCLCDKLYTVYTLTRTHTRARSIASIGVNGNTIALFLRNTDGMCKRLFISNYTILLEFHFYRTLSHGNVRAVLLVRRKIDYAI